jgi:TetR/AcrR family transcriptional regulator
MLNWFYMWFREGGPISREEYAALATKMLVNGVRGFAGPRSS